MNCAHSAMKFKLLTPLIMTISHNMIPGVTKLRKTIFKTFSSDKGKQHAAMDIVFCTYFPTRGNIEAIYPHTNTNLMVKMAMLRGKWKGYLSGIPYLDSIPLGKERIDVWW